MIKKRIKPVSFFLAVFLSAAVLGLSGFGMLPVNAQEKGQLTDAAGLLEESEAEQVEEKTAQIKESTGWEVMSVTADDADGMGTSEYAEQWLDQHMTGEDGVICMIDMDNREIAVIGTGEANYYLTDDRTDRILDDGYDEITDENYAGTLLALLDGVEQAYKAGVPSGSHLYDEDTKEVTSYREGHREITRMELLIAAALALAAGGITAAVIIGKYRLKFGGYKYPIEKNGSVKLRREEDIFVNQFVTHRHIPKPDNSGGGGSGRSTVHTGSGGRSYSGGSRKF